MSRFDQAGAGLAKPIGLPTKEDEIAISIQRRKDADRGRAYRKAKRNNDLQGILAAEGAGYTNRGIENTEDKNARYREAGHQRGFAGSTAVGGGQGAGGAQQPAGGVRGPAQAGITPVEGRDDQGRPISMLDEEGRPVSPINGNRQAPASGAAPTGTQPAAPAKPKSFFEERASGRSKFVDVVTANKGEDGFSDKFEEQARKQGKALGLTPEQVQATLDGYGDKEGGLSPEAIADRAKSRKDEASKKREGGTRIIPWEERLQMEEKERLDAAQRGESGKPYEFEELDNKLDEIGRKAGVAAEKGHASVERTKNVLNDVNVTANRTTANSGVIRPSDNRPSLNQFMDSLDDPIGPIAGNNKESPLIPTEKPNNETIKGEVVRPDRVWGEGLGSDAVNTISATGQVLGGWGKNIWRGAEIGSKFISDAEVGIDASRRSEGARAMDFAGKVGEYLMGGKKKPKANDSAPPQASNQFTPVSSNDILKSFDDAEERSRIYSRPLRMG